MANQTQADYLAAAQACNFGDDGAVSKLITSSYTETMINEMVLEKHIDCDGAGAYFNGFFGSEVWQDGQGMDEVREYSTQSYIPISNEYFVKKMKPCVGAADQGNCDWEECEVPEGGRGTLPPFTFYQWALKTPRTCIADIRHIRQFLKWSGKMVENRERADKQIMNMFYTMMGWKTAGHKVVLEYDKDVNGRYTPKPMVDARNPFRGFSHNYMQEYFPDVENPENIGPLDIGALSQLSRTWTQSCNNNHVATGSRGEKIWEMWFSDDWYQTEGLQNPDFIEKIRRTMPSKEFAGYSLAQPEREVIGNWAMRTMEWLPRLAESTEGGLIPIDTHTGLDIEVGKEYVLSPSWQNAPFSVAMMPSPKQGTIMTRPDLTHSGDGIPILPITGSSPWRFRNDYDAECNKQLNKPFAQKRYEMGFRMDDPDAGTAVIHRNRKFHVQAEQFCDLNDVFTVAPNEVCNDSVGIGCRGGKSGNQASLTGVNNGKIVNCSTESCPGEDNGIYKIEIDRVPNMPDFNSLGCECGSIVDLQIGDDTGVVTYTTTAKVLDVSLVFPKGYVFVQLTSGNALPAGECIKGVICQDASPQSAVVVTCSDVLDENEDPVLGKIRVVLDAPISNLDDSPLAIGDTVSVSFNDVNNVAIVAAGNPVTATIDSFDENINTYYLDSTDDTFNCTGTDATRAVGDGIAYFTMVNATA